MSIAASSRVERLAAAMAPIGPYPVMATDVPSSSWS